MRRRSLLVLPLAIVACAPALAPTRPASPNREPTVALPSASSLPPLPTCEASPSASAAPSAVAETHDAPRDAPAAFDDGFEPPPSADAAGAPSPLDAVSDAELEAKLAKDPSSLGSISIGGIHSGALLYGVQMQSSAHWEMTSPVHAWGTREAVDQLSRAIDRVNAEIPGTPRLFIGDLSAKNGGHLPPHVSHQSGRDADVGYYYTTADARWYAPATAANLDRARTWALVKALLVEADVEMILMDTSVQKLVKDYAREQGEDAAWLDDVFQVGGHAPRPIIFYAPGHQTHLHVRFYAPESRELGRRAYATLLKRKLIKPPTYFVDHVVKSGETLGAIAAKYKTSVDAIKKANRMSSSVVVRGRAYKVPQSGGIERPAAKVVAPARRLPPAKAIANLPASGGADGDRDRNENGAAPPKPCRPSS